jgi:EAL domain-containing protein (putative c-di-GMP-specific phosphodiesterase class I)
VHILKPSDSEVSRRRGDMEWAGRITSALQENRMYLMVQPAKALRGNLAISEYQEVLLRMNDESGKPVPTEALIGAAERYNLMPGKLDRWVVQTACRLVSERKIAADPRRIVAINLSGSSLSDEAFLKFVHQQINSFRIEPTAICFEVTETAAIRNLSKAIHFLKSLKSIGCRFALDDFGSGLCSFAYLKSLPVDFLKIDGAFVRNLVDSPFDRAMVDSIAKIGRVLGIPTIAEWVENDETLRELTLLGIDYAQGYGVAKPHRVG